MENIEEYVNKVKNSMKPMDKDKFITKIDGFLYQISRRDPKLDRNAISIHLEHLYETFLFFRESKEFLLECLGNYCSEKKINFLEIDASKFNNFNQEQFFSNYFDLINERCSENKGILLIDNLNIADENSSYRYFMSLLTSGSIRSYIVKDTSIKPDLNDNWLVIGAFGFEYNNPVNFKKRCEYLISLKQLIRFKLVEDNQETEK